MNEKYSRQELFAPIGKSGQEQIRRLKVLIMGAGALGSASAEMLVRAGVRKLTIVDRDMIEWSNLHRQQLYTEQDVIDRLPKAISAQNRLVAINSDVAVTGIVMDVSATNVEELIKGHDLVVDGTDNMEIRLLMNDATRKAGIPFFMGACVGSYGVTFPIGVKQNQPCLHCLIETLPSHMMTCDTAGVISPVVVTTAARQVAAVLKYKTGEVTPKLQSVDLWTEEHASIDVSSFKKVDCPSCSSMATYPFLQLGAATRTAVLCGRDTVQLTFPPTRQFELAEVAVAIEGKVTELKHNDYVTVCLFQDHRIVFFRDGRLLVHGTKDVTVARKLTAALLG
ncbi:molybdopterin/thiamine biosynthesis adenylyltransferase [Sporosarcina luteola]|nr:molybdopterin/thiamine biosynthesis adenylyltransferase [Sporosarcina luteola]